MQYGKWALESTYRSDGICPWAHGPFILPSISGEAAINREERRTCDVHEAHATRSSIDQGKTARTVDAKSSNWSGMDVVWPHGHGVWGSSSASRRSAMLHGSLDIWIHEARNLPNMDIISKTVVDILGTKKKKKAANGAMTSDPYVTVQLASATVARTYVVNDDENPVWAQHFLVPVAHEAPAVHFLVKDSDVFGAELIGEVVVPAEQLEAGEHVEGVYPVLDPAAGKPCAPGAVLRLSVQYIPVARLTMYHHGVTPGPDFAGVPNTYFPLRRGGRVTLYQDAHVPEGSLPEIRLGNGALYRQGQCWHDVYDAISQARRLIYITGWSVFHTIQLVRDGGAGGGAGVSLGDLLKRKSQEGVRVLLLVWDDPTSRNVLGIQMVCTMQHAITKLIFGYLFLVSN